MNTSFSSLPLVMMNTFSLRAFSANALVIALLGGAFLFFAQNALADASVPSATTNYLAVSISDNASTVAPGGQLTYLLQVQNAGTDSRTTSLQFTFPSAMSVLSATENPANASSSLTWKNLVIAPGHVKIFTVSMRVQDTAVNNYILHTRLQAGSASAIDDTRVEGQTSSAVKVVMTLNADATTAKPNEDVEFEIELRSIDGRSVALRDLTATIPAAAYFNGATDGGEVQGGVIRWPLISITGSEKKRIQYRLKVRADAQQSADIRSTVTTSSVSASDNATVRGGYTTTTYNSSTTYYPSATTYYPSTATTTYKPIYTVANTTDGKGTTVDGKGKGKGKGPEPVFFTKTASQMEALPNSQITYHLTVRNILDHAISNVVITDRFDSSLARLLSSKEGVQIDDSTQRFYIPSLQVGQEWSTSYVLLVHPNAPKGAVLSNVATITGDGLEGLTLTQRVTVVGTGIITQSPRSGAPLDALFVLLTLPAGLAAAFLQRKVLI